MPGHGRRLYMPVPLPAVKKRIVMKTTITLQRLLIAAALVSGLSTNAATLYEPRPLPAREFSIGIKLGLSDMWGDVGTRGVGAHYFSGLYFQ